MRNTNYTQALSSTRKLKARVTFTDKLMRFAVLQASESITIASTDSDMNGSELLRVAVEAATNKIFFAQHSSNDAGFAATTWTDTGKVALAGSRVGLVGNRLFYQAADGTIYYCDKGASAFGADTSTTITYTQPLSIAPVSSTEFYVVSLDGDGVNDYMMRRVFYHTTAGASAEYHGRLYGDTSVLNIVDAVRQDNVDYIYFLDNSEKRTVYIKRSGDWWSEVQQVVPMDVVDDMTSFVMSSAAVINGIVLVTGVLRRTYGDPLHVYMVGPEEFTAGRELAIRPEDTDKVGGKLHLFDGKTWYVGAGLRFYAEQTAYLGVDNPALSVAKEDLLDFVLRGSPNNPYSLNLKLFHDFTHPAFRPGSQARLEVAVNGEYSDLGTFNIDGFSRPIETSGSVLDVTLRSDGYKRLSQWVSDTSYDYWSQTKVDTDPANLTDLVRVNGQWETHANGLYLDDFNERCYLYTSAKSCRNGIMRARFRRYAGTYQANFGVGLNFYRESAYDAATRLGIDMSEVEESDYGVNGIFAIYGEGLGPTGQGVSLYSVRSGEFTWLANGDFSTTVDTDYWIMIRFNEGQIKASMRSDTSNAWTEVVSTIFSRYDQVPWANESEGRGAIYFKNATMSTPIYAMDSEQDYIPVADISGWPEDREVIIDSERIFYDAKALPKSMTFTQEIGPFTYWRGHPADGYETVGTNYVLWGDSRARLEFIQNFKVVPSMFLHAMKFAMYKQGHPFDGILVRVYKIDAGAPSPFGYLVDEQRVPATAFKENEVTWVELFFKSKAIWTSTGEAYRFILYRDNSVADDGGAEYSSANCYKVPAPGGAYPWNAYTFNEDTDTFNAVTKGLPFRIYNKLIGPLDGNFMYCQYNSTYFNSKPDVNEYNDFNKCAVVVTEGADAGSVYWIGAYLYYSGTCGLSVDDDIRFKMVHGETKFKITPTLTELTRAYSGTLAAAHPEGTMCHLYQDRPFLTFDRVQFYSSEQDNSLEDMIRIIARKAGVLQTRGANLYPDQITPSTNTLVLDQKNFRVEFDFDTPFTVNSIVISGRRETESGAGADLHLTGSAIAYYSGATLVETYPLPQALSGKVIITYYDRYVSTWCNGAFVYSFTLRDGEADGNYFTVSGTHTSPVNIYVPEAAIRIDNYILDAGQRGDSLVSGVIGEKRFYLADDISGDFKLFRERTTVNTALTPYQLSISGGEVQSDTALATRMRLEGADIREKFDTDMIVNFGNLFYMANMYEINSAADADYFTDVLLDDAGSRVISKAYEGAADPRVEPNDIVYVETKDGLDRVIVDNIDLFYSVSRDNVVFDMSINGRIPREDLTT